MKDKIKQAEMLCRELKLPYMSKNIEVEYEEALTANIEPINMLLSMLTREYELRLENGKQNRIRRANFPYKKYMEDLKEEFLPEDARKKLWNIKKLDFIENHQNLILAGNPGTGKTHLAIATGILACNQGYKVLFTTVSSMINRLKETKSQKTLIAFENQIEKYDLLILDELGYISFDKEGSELLFTHLSLRAERKSTIITTNLSFERWEEIFKDPVMTAAMIDRLTHKSYVVNMNGNSYRLKETQDMLQSL
ncbi:MAG: IS21-like element helper ATPase IstB [Tissierellia bacterium]|nr:IS21-like element helper ATPase IstB [Tissierellia bacterium]